MFTCSNLVIFPGVGAFEQLFGPVRWKFEQKFSLNARGFARGGMLKLRFDWYKTFEYLQENIVKNLLQVIVTHSDGEESSIKVNKSC